MGRLSPHDGVCVLVLCVLAIVVCWPAFQSRTIPLDTRALLDAPPWRDLSQPKQAPPNDGYARREALTRYPDFAFMASTIERGGDHTSKPLS